MGSVLFPDEGFQRRESCHRKLGAGEDHSGQRRLGEMRERDIIKTDQRYVVGNFQSSVMNCSQRSNRSQVVRGDDRSGRLR